VAGDTPHDVSIPLDGLTPSTTWHYRICAEDAQARTCSKDATLFTGDSVTGRGLAGGLWAFKFDAHSGPSGENPTGTAFWGHGPSLIFEGPVTCLAVAGNRAVIGMDSSISPLLLYALDSPGGDKATFELVNEPPTTCPPPLDSDFEGASSVGLGDIVVTDVDPQPTSQDH
jgi:hypothetical protein